MPLKLLLCPQLRPGCILPATYTREAAYSGRGHHWIPTVQRVQVVTPPFVLHRLQF